MALLIGTEKYKLALFPLVQNSENYAQKCIRELLQDESVRLGKRSSGQPFLIGNEWNVSLSHCRDYLAVALCRDFIPGVDIEDIRDKVLRIAPRVFSAEELEQISAMPRLEACHILWGAKEAVYKSYGERGLIFSKDIRVSPFDYSPHGGRFKAKLRNSKLYSLRYLFPEKGKILVYTEALETI